jgi:DNA repair photolyase
VSVTLSVTTLDSDLARRLEPRAAQPRARLAAIEALARAGVPVGVNAAPVIPGLTDHELPAILQAAADHGAMWAGYVMLRLPHGVRELFEGWLDTHRPDRKKRVLNRVRDVRGGRLNDPRFGSRMRGRGLYAEQIDQLFRMARSRAGLDRERRPLSTAHFRRPAGGQLELFER